MAWKNVHLQELVTIRNGKDHKHLNSGEYPVYGSGGLMRYADSYLYDKESVLLPRKGSLNNIQYVKTPFWTVDTLYYTKIQTEIVIPYYLYSCLKQFDIEKLNTGSAIPSMTFDKYYSLQIPLPPFETQKKIADILGAYDELIENNRKQIALLEEAAQRLYKEWFVDLRFPGHETTPIDPTTNLPHDWSSCKLKELFSIKTGKKNANFGAPDGLFPFFTCAQEPRTSPSYSFDTSASILAGNGDLYSRLFRGKFEAYQRTYVLEPNELQHLYLGLCAVDTSMSILKKGANGSTIKYLTKGMIENIKIPIPTANTLKRFNENFEAYQSGIEHAEVEIKNAQEARDRLLPKLMSGEIEVQA